MLPPFTRQRTVGKRGENGTARLALMAAICKPALREPFLHIGKACTYAFAGIKKPKLTHSRRIDDHRTGGEHEQLTVRCRMPPPAINLSDRLNPHYVLFYQCIEQR
ncbi:hypothetical protein D3C71_1633860 [compost metagenome]